MLFTRHMGLALAGASLLFSHARASFDFPSCVDNCIESSGYEPDSAKSICKGARNLLLDSVISCLFFNCKSDLRNVEGAFLDPIAEACEDSDREIPSSKLAAAESLASSYISKLPTSTTARTTTAAQSTTTPPKTTITSKQAVLSSSSASATTTTAAATEDEESAPPSTSTSASDQDAGQSTSAAGETTAAPTTTQVTLPTSATRSAAASSSSSAPDSGSGFDTNPFGSSSSAGSAIRPLISLLGLPLTVVSLLALR
ncbi:hypothetical protein N657DRAFT_629443 [Parathielavia appendiculata]|uniref:Extracellular membrane protein CFEM domain-containing protein n=1 Tax=Parathielavia appendiculata TaxID=2587402 RepID=A0AAN6Z7X9_9PEZI|nr:hypothetical protein N657DRAFT_629443 [Parathielavia appendiculata]